MVAVERGSNKLMLENKGKVFNLQPSIIFYSMMLPRLWSVMSWQQRQGRGNKKCKTNEEDTRNKLMAICTQQPACCPHEKGIGCWRQGKCWLQLSRGLTRRCRSESWGSDRGYILIVLCMQSQSALGTWTATCNMSGLCHLFFYLLVWVPVARVLSNVCQCIWKKFGTRSIELVVARQQ